MEKIRRKCGCGGKQELIKSYSNGDVDVITPCPYYRISCERCFASGPWKPTAFEAWAAWDRREGKE